MWFIDPSMPWLLRTWAQARTPCTLNPPALSVLPCPSPSLTWATKPLQRGFRSFFFSFPNQLAICHLSATNLKRHSDTTNPTKNCKILLLESFLSKENKDKYSFYIRAKSMTREQCTSWKTHYLTYNAPDHITVLKARTWAVIDILPRVLTI